MLIVLGTISFIYADGITIIYQTWLNLITPRLTFELHPENTLIPADGSSQIYIDIQLKNKKDQLLDGAEISTTIISGQADLTQADNPPTDMSKRIWLRAPYQPQFITLAFNYSYLNKNLIIEAFDPNLPPAPVIKAPAMGAIFTTATPIVSGEGPTNSQIEIYIDDQLNTITPIDNSGNFSTALKQAVRKGKHKLSARSLNKYGIRSPLTPTLTITIQTPDPEIDLLNLRIKPNPASAGGSFQFFIPVSAGTKSVTLTIDNHSYPLQDVNNSSIFSGNIPAPKQPGWYPLSLIITTVGGDSIVAEKVASIQIK